MTTKEWLMRGWKLNDEIVALEEVKRRMYLRCTSATVIPKDICVTGSSNANSTEAQLVDYSDLSKEIDKMNDKYKSIAVDILRAVQRITYPPYRTLLEHRYLNMKDWGEIARAMDYTESYVRGDLHSNALIALTKVRTQ